MAADWRDSSPWRWLDEEERLTIEDSPRTMLGENRVVILVLGVEA